MTEHYNDLDEDTFRFWLRNQADRSDKAKNARLRDALKNLVSYAERSECQHENTHRGGAIWTICDDCGGKWADDQGGFKPYCEPVEITAARQALGEKE
jgi:ribosomal protein L37AE/L43A